MKMTSRMKRNIAIILCLPFLLGTVTRCSCTFDFSKPFLDNYLWDYFEKEGQRPDGIEKYDNILYEIHKEELDKLDEEYNNSTERSPDRIAKEKEDYYRHKYDLYKPWDDKITELEEDGMTREEAVKEAAVEELIKEKGMDRDEAEKYYDEHWGDKAVEETEETSEVEETETTEETTTETTTGMTLEEQLEILKGKWYTESYDDEGERHYAGMSMDKSIKDRPEVFSLDPETGGVRQDHGALGYLVYIIDDENHMHTISSVDGRVQYWVRDGQPDCPEHL